VVLGLERGWTHAADGEANPGIRTFALTALLGGLLTRLDPTVLVPMGFVAVAALALLGYRATSKRFNDYGYTTEIALVVAYACGITAGLGELLLAISSAAIAALILGLKPELHGFVQRLKRLEVLSTIQLLVVAVVLLPLLPNRDVWVEGLNFRTIGWFVLLILGLSYLGYVSVRTLGDRLGVLLTAIFGGLTSSTAVTATLSRMAAAQPQAAPLLAAGVLLACAVMPIRLLILTTVVNGSLTTHLGTALVVLAAVPVCVAAALVLRNRGADASASLALNNPLELKGAALFAVFLTVLFVAVPWLEGRFGSGGLYIAALISGLTDVDAIGLTLAEKSITTTAAETAAFGILLAAWSNTVVKAVLAAALSHGRLTRLVAVTLVAAVLLTALIQVL
jgi:uncharacterized membrane protein (DUF4010 family)